MHITMDIGGNDLLERISWICQIVIAVIALVGTLFAGYQLLLVRRVSQATLLLELDARFDSRELREARDLFARLRNDINGAVATENPKASDAARRDLVCEKWRTTLRDMRAVDDSDDDRYLDLIAWIGFFETVGLMVNKDYISEKDVLDLFRGPLIDLGNSFKLHIEDRCKESGVAKGLFEHALALSSAAAKGN